MTSAFEDYSTYYNFLYQGKDYQGEVNYLESIFSQHRLQGKDLLEFGSGTGGHASILSGRGFKICGVEQSAKMVAQAKISENFTCVQGDVRSVDMAKTFDAVISLFHVMSYQIGNNDLKAVFYNAAKHLNSNGLFIFDFWYSPAVYAQQPEVRIKRMSNNEYEVLRIAEPKIINSENRVDVQIGRAHV